MDTQAAAVTALLGYVLFLALAFGLRTLVQLRRTGSTGFVGMRGEIGSFEWWGGVLFIVALVAGAAAPILQLTGSLAGLEPFDRFGVRELGLGFYLLGIGGTLWAQFAMGDSWRIGVDATARTSLVVSGPFRWVRNPIFTAMLLATIGLFLLVPNAAAAFALLALVMALEIQVRLVEEPYLERTHGERYRVYGATTGRFLPGIGRTGLKGVTP
jgi:protein-S-isoprenylcysteine O-methyltransferase Ste14